MGNSESNGDDKGPKVEDTVKDGIIAADVKDDTNKSSATTMTPVKSNADQQNNKRRIVKAKTPSTTTSPAFPIVSTDNEDSIKNDSNGKKRVNNDPNDFLVLESPSTIASKRAVRDTSQQQQNESEKWKKERFDVTAERRKTHHNKKLEERRKNPTSNNGKSEEDKNEKAEEEKKEQPSYAPNPMSRFLSVFSVEPQFPEHKRKSLEVVSPEEEDDNEDRKGRSEKRQRTGASSSDGMFCWSRKNRRVVGALVLSVVAAATVVSLIHFRRRK